MKKLLLIIFCQLSVLTVFGQLDSDFLEARRKADDCFKKGDFSCAKENYQTALAIKENDEYCKKKLNEIKQEDEERKLKAIKEREAQRREREANKSYVGTLTGLVDSYGEVFSYIGEIKNKQPNGKGKAEKKYGVYDGVFKNGYMNGFISVKFTNGDYLEGQFVNDSLNGFGKKSYYTEGYRYEGEWKGNVIDGEGTYYFSNGNYLILTQSRGKWLNRYGKYYWANGDKYEGEFYGKMMIGHNEDFFPDSCGLKIKESDRFYKTFGYGKFTFINGSYYNGGYKENMKHGIGEFHSSDGSIYIGEWKDDKKNGKGTYTHSNRDKYEGEWKDDILTGQVNLFFVNGIKYAGEWKDSKINGKGVLTAPKGKEIKNCPMCVKFDGEWINGVRQGEGKCYDSNDKIIYEGKFKNDVPTEKYPNRK